MPELPEVEVVRAGLAAVVTGRTVRGVQVLHPRPVRAHPAGVEGFITDLTGRTLAEPRRRGKYLWLPFTDGDALLVHLGMSGQFRVDERGAPLLANTRLLVDFDDGADQLRFIDQRMFGGLQISPCGAVGPDQIAHIALDPFDPDFDPEKVARSMRSRRSTVKRALLDQRLVSSVGNIYADESLWRTRLHYDQPTDAVTQRRAVGLLRAAREVMSEALAQGGTSFDALYVNVNGASGYFSRNLAVYGREGQSCDRCGTPVVREPFMNRSAFRCPRCQPRPTGTTPASVSRSGNRVGGTSTGGPVSVYHAPNAKLSPHER